MHAYTITIESGETPFELDSFLENLRERFKSCEALSFTSKKLRGVWEVHHTNGILLLRTWQDGLSVNLVWDTLSFSTGAWMVGKITIELMERDHSFSALACDAGNLINAARLIQGAD